METILWIVGATLAVSLISLIGIFFLSMKEGLLNRLVLLLVALSAGALMGGAFLHLLPEAVEIAGAAGIDVFLWALAGFVAFFLIEKILHWRHCHKGKCDIHTFTYMNIVGDGIHNFIDGLVIAASFLVSVPLGIATTIAIAFHEIPQEIGDFGVLVYGGFSKGKALALNLATALTAVLGGVAGYFAAAQFGGLQVILLAVAAGGFIYIASSDLLPELRKITETRKLALNFIVFLTGIGIMWLTKIIFGG